MKRTTRAVVAAGRQGPGADAVMKVCLHPRAVSRLVTPVPRIRYERKIPGPGKGVIHRVRLTAPPYWDVRCPDCPAHAYWAQSGHDYAQHARMAPWLFAEPEMEETP